jgi:hypothetical protein
MSVFADLVRPPNFNGSHPPPTAPPPSRRPEPKSLPIDIETENRLLASVMHEPALFGERDISRDLFANPSNQILFDVLYERWDNGAQLIPGEFEDFTVLVSSLAVSGELAECGGREHLDEILSSTPGSSLWRHYAGILRRTLLARIALAGFYRIATEVAQLSKDPLAAVSEILTSLERVMPRPEPAFENAAALCESQVPIPPEIVGGVLHQGSKLALGGSSKSYKTWLLIDLAVSVCHGLKWLGFPTTKGNVLYINLEIQRPFFRRRLRHVCARRSCPVPENLQIWNLRGESLSIRAIQAKLSEWTNKGDFSLLIIDPIYKTYAGRDENATGQITEVVNVLEAIARSLDVAIAWAAHFSKGNQSDKEAIDRISGSGVWGRDPDSILTFTKHEEENSFVVQLTLRDFPQLEDFVVRFEDNLLVRDTKLDPARFKKPRGGRPSLYSPNDLAEVLGQDELSTKEFAERAETETGMKRDTFFRIKKIAEQKKLIAYDGITQKWQCPVR